MTTRDRLVLMTIVALVALGGVWLLIVAPQREQVSKLDSQVSTAQQSLTAAQAQVSQARGAQAQYVAAYASVVRLGKAVPADEQVPSLVYELDQASNHKHVQFSSITSSSAGGSPASAAGAATASAVAASAGFSKMPFTFTFNGSFFDLYNLLKQLNDFTLRTSSGIQATGRLLTIQSVNLAPAGSTGTAGSSKGELTGTVTATAYVLPTSQSLTGGATPAGPAGTTSSPPSSGAPAPAVIKVNP
jgi:Tfp pilus assembly protein PilO